MNVRRAVWLGGIAAVLAVVAGLYASDERPPESGFSPLVAFSSDNEGVVVVTGRGAWLGIHVSDVTAEKMAELKLEEEYGALITEVEENSPAAKAGLAKNDVILEYQGQRVESAAQLTRLVRETPVGRSVRLLISRAGNRQTLAATLERREYARGEFRLPRIEIPRIRVRGLIARPRLGIEADALTPQLADYFGVKQGKGILVRSVESGTPAEKADLKAGDVIVSVDGQAVADVGDLRAALGKKKGGESVTLGLVRDRKETTLQVQLEEPRRSAFDSLEVIEPHVLDLELESLRDLQRRLREELEGKHKALEQEQRALQEHLRRMQMQLQRVTI